MLISIPRSANKSHLHNLARKQLGTYLILKDDVWYKMTKQYSSVNNKLTYLGEVEEVFPLSMKAKYAIIDEWVCSEDCYEECCTGQCNIARGL